MRFATFELKSGAERFGFVAENGSIVDLEGAFAAKLAADIPVPKALDLASVMAPPDAQSFIEGGETCIAAGKAAKSFVDSALASGKTPNGPRGEAIVHAQDAIRIKAPIPRLRKFIAAGKNYFAHQMEMQKRADPRAPRVPIAHVQFASTVVGTDETVYYPKETQKLDYEVEVAVVIGRRAYNVSEEDALDYVFGYTIFNDVSARDVYNGERDNGGGIGMLGKNLPGFAPMGPWLVSADEIGDPKGMGLRSRVNGETRQDATIALMMFDMRQQIAHWSKIGLEPGDVLGTGTPGGVAAGRKPDEKPWWLHSGDVVECEVDRIGVLRTYIG